MSTYMDILRAHQKGKLKGPKSTPAESAPSPAPIPEPEAKGASPDALLQKEAPPVQSLAEPPAAPEPSVPPAPATPGPDPDSAERESSVGMPEESAAAQARETDETVMPESPLPEEPDQPSHGLDVDASALNSTLPDEGGGIPADVGDMDDALFAQMLEEEPETSAESNPADQSASDALLADETPEILTQDTGDVAAKNSIHTWLSGCVMLLVRLYGDAARNNPTDISPLLHHLDELGAKIYEGPEELGALELDIANRIESIRGSDADCGDLLQKAVMMMLYALKVCVQMHMEPTEITRYAAAAILHNIGMAQVFVDTRLKEGKLSPAERTLIRAVADKSVDYLKRSGITDRVILQAALQSQERHDGSGPHGLAGNDISLSARIVGLLSMFEALVHVRTYRERLLPRDAIRDLVNRYKQQFDPAILKQLIESVSLYPVGTYVQLNSGDIGQVVRVQPRLPLRPKIVLTMDRHGNRIQPREVDLQKQPNLMVQHCMYREGMMSMKSMVTEEEEA